MAEAAGHQERFTRFLRCGVQLPHREFDRAAPGASGSPHFPASAKDRRSVPSLFCGATGALLFLDQVLDAGDDRLFSLDRLSARFGAAPARDPGHARIG